MYLRCIQAKRRWISWFGGWCACKIIDAAHDVFMQIIYVFCCHPKVESSDFWNILFTVSKLKEIISV